MALAKRGAAASNGAQEFVPFLSPDFYSGGGNAIPPGEYALEFEVVMHQGTNKSTGIVTGPPRLSVMVTAYPLNDPDPEANKKQQPLSMGSKADQSFAPSADGKKLVAKPGGPGVSSLNDKTNWAFFLTSMFNAGLPHEVVASGDLSAIDGMWVSLANVPEPEERKGFKSQAATGEASTASTEARGTFMIPAVSEILEGGMPWEGGGGMPDPGGAPAPKTPARAVAAPKATPVARARPSAPATTSNGNVRDEAVSATGKVLEGVDIKKGITRNKLRNEVFKVSGAGEMAEAILSEFFASDDTLNELLSEHGFALNGSNVVSA